MKKTIALAAAVMLLVSVLGTVYSNADVKYIAQADYEAYIGSALVMISGDGNDLYTTDVESQEKTQNYLSENFNTVHGPFASLKLKGWFGTDQTITAFGYAIDDAEPVFLDGIFTEVADWVLTAGGENSRGYEMTVDVSGITEGKVLIRPVVKLEDGTVIEATYLDVYYTPEPAGEQAKPQLIEFTEGSNGNAMNFSGCATVGFRFTVPEGMKLVKFTVADSPTWNGPATGIGCTANIYRWTANDFDETLDSESLGEVYEEDHKDNDNLDLEFENIHAGEYLVVLTDFTGNLGGWGANGIKAEYADSFFYYNNGEEMSSVVKCKMTVIADDNPPEITEEPAATEQPTEVPATATPAPTEVPATEEPAATAAPTEEPAEEPVKSSKTGLIIGIIAAAAVLACVVLAVALRGKRKTGK